MKNLKKNILPNLLTIVIILFFLLEFFLIDSYVKKIYLRDDIENFRKFEFWKVYFSIWAVILVSFIIFKFNFSIKRLGYVLFCFLIFYFLQHNLVLNITLYINQLHQNKTERKVYKLYNDKKYLQLFLDDEKDKESIYDESDINKINVSRERKMLKKIQNLPTHDSVCVDYKVGIFGLKYLK